MNTIQAGARAIGPDEPCFIAAEIGINHNGDMELARKTIDAAVEAGADAVKFQNYETEDFISDRSLSHEYVSQGERIVESQYEMFKRYELSEEQIRVLKEYCDEQGILFFSTPTSRDGLETLLELEVPLLKNGSDFLGHLPLIRAMGDSGVPTILSTGMATLGDIDRAVRAFEEAGGKDLILLHCVSSYPAPPESVNLRSMTSLEAPFDRPVGFSDHTDGIAVAVAAAALGACMIEKHFTLDRSLPGPDHRFSSDPGEFAALAAAVRTVEEAMGVREIGPSTAEGTSRDQFTLSCVAATDLPEGHTLRESDLAFRRPGGGVEPRNVRFLIGRTLRASMEEGKRIHMDDLV